MQGRITKRAPRRSISRPIAGEHTATVNAVTVNAREASPRDQPNSFVHWLRKMPKVKISSEPKLTKTPETAASTIGHRRWEVVGNVINYFSRWLFLGHPMRSRLGTARVAVLRRTLGAYPVRFFAHRVHAACVNPPVVEVEQRAYRERVVNCFIRITCLVQRFHVVGPNPHRVEIHLPHKPEQSLLLLTEPGRFQILQHARHEFLASQQL